MEKINLFHQDRYFQAFNFFLKWDILFWALQLLF